MASRWRGWFIAGCWCALSALSSCSADSTAMGSDAATPSPSGEAAVGGDAVDAPVSDEASGGVDGAAIVDASGAGVDALANDAGPPTRDGALPALDRPEPGTDAPATSPAPPEPSARPQPDPCRTLTPTIQGTGGPDTIRGTPGRDVIFAGDGDDVIDGGGGDDVICGGNGEDVIDGGGGDDYIDGGAHNDRIRGGDGDDVIHGRSGSDEIRGGGGDDLISGDLLDDDLYGDEGNDVLLGGHGTDFLHGGPGADWLRGDTGHDDFVGGEGVDVVSFSTASPPGQPILPETSAAEGVTVDLTARVAADDNAFRYLTDHGFSPAEIASAGVASGDGYREALLGVERVVGSHFGDVLIASSREQVMEGGAGDDTLRGPAGATLTGGVGRDTCNGAPCDAPGEPPGRSAGPMVFVDASPRDTGLALLGSTNADGDAFTVIVGDATAVVSSGGAAITPGAGCAWVDAARRSVVTCAFASAPRYLMGFGGAGDDRFTIQRGIPRDMTTHVNGGEGSDTISGSEGEDVLFSGPDGRDVLSGNEGDDALLSESPAMDPATRGEAYAGGADRLDGGEGNDQLVSDYPCGGHSFVGGPGIDIAGFRRSTGTRPPFYGINAQLGGPAAMRQLFHGRAFNPARCALDPWGTHLAGDLEVLEGADGDDNLFGNDNSNVIWAWGGRDTLVGYGGNDRLDGHAGDDEIYGGEGRDELRGHSGFDRLFARDNEADAVVDCGADEGRIESQDANDPVERNCRPGAGDMPPGPSACGDAGQPCCPSSDPCPGTGVACFSGTCQRCGVAGAPCCPSSDPCPGTGVACFSGTCQRCGVAGARCCPSGTPCPGGRLTCQSGTCR